MLSKKWQINHLQEFRNEILLHVSFKAITGTSGWISVGGQSRAQGEINSAQEKVNIM